MSEVEPNENAEERAKVEKMKEENERLKYRIKILEKALEEGEN